MSLNSAKERTNAAEQKLEELVNRVSSVEAKLIGIMNLQQYGDIIGRKTDPQGPVFQQGTVNVTIGDLPAYLSEQGKDSPAGVVVLQGISLFSSLILFRMVGNESIHPEDH